MRFILVYLAALASCSGQIRGLATTMDGSRVYFDSTFRLRGSQENLSSKIFMIDQNGAHLVDDEGGPQIVNGATTYYDLYGPNVSGDGSFVMYTAHEACPVVADVCYYGEWSSPMTPPGVPNPLAGAQGGVMISRNGRYAVLFHTAPPGRGMPIAVVDLTTGTQSSNRYSSEVHAVANDGTTLAQVAGPHGDGLALVDFQGNYTIIGPDFVNYTSMSDDATVIAYSVNSKGLIVTDNKGNARALTVAGSNASGPELSSDGSTVLYQSPAGGVVQLFLAQTDGSSTRQLTDAPEGAFEGSFSGDGKVAYAITGSNALLRIDTQTGEAVQLIGPSPSLNTAFTGGHAPGSAIVVDGTNLALPGIVTVADQAAPVMYASPKQIIFQIPWEAPVEPRPVIAFVPEVQIRNTALVLPGADPYLDAAFWFPVYAFDPVAVALGPSDPRFGSPIALHQDGGIVTPDSPAEPGEIVTLYATGFGPVSPAVPDGTPAAVDPPSIMTLPVQLLFMVTSAGSTPQRAAMTYAGLAPGYVGLYQINLQIPDGLDGIVPLVACAEDPCEARSYLGVLAISATVTQR